MMSVTDWSNSGYYFANREWAPWLAVFALGMALLTWWSYRKASMPTSIKIVGISLRVIGVALLLVCLLEPTGVVERAKPQANTVAVVVDNSQSLREEWLAYGKSLDSSKGDEWRKLLLSDEADWQRQLADEFRVRRYVFDDSLDAIDSFEGIPQSGTESAMVRALLSLRDRYQEAHAESEKDLSKQPIAGVLLFTDGHATDRDKMDLLEKYSIPIFPVLTPKLSSKKDLIVSEVSTTQSDFETAPVTIRASITHRGYSRQTVWVECYDSQDTLVESKSVELKGEGQRVPVEFRFRPSKAGIQGYRVLVRESQTAPLPFVQKRVSPTQETGAAANPSIAATNSSEFTLFNNQRYQLVDRGRGPYRILYVAGRPNWEFKFLTRALAEDDEIRLTGLVRIAKKEPKFSFRDNKVDSANPLFSGFEDISDEEKASYDEPVYVRLGVMEPGQLSKGFPKDLDELYSYHAIVLDDLEPSFFSQEQQSQLRQFVSIRGGGLLQLGGSESMRGEDFRNSVLSQLLPLYGLQEQLRQDDLTSNPNDVPITAIRMQLTREGWLQPFMRLSETENGEKSRLEKMPGFQVWNRIQDIKPGASILANAVDESENPIPLLVTQKFGRGRTSALLIGDWWRWAMHREGSEPTPLYQAWRQLIRWLVNDVPKSIQVSVESMENSSRMKRITVDVKGTDFQIVDNAGVNITVTKPDGSTQEKRAEPSSQIPGRYECMTLCDQEGVYAAVAQCNAPDNSELGSGQAGWIVDLMASEFAMENDDQTWLSEIAQKSGGKVLSTEDLDSFASEIPADKIPVREKKEFPLWHQSWVVLVAIGCLCCEWGWRRRYGMA